MTSKWMVISVGARRRLIGGACAIVVAVSSWFTNASSAQAPPPTQTPQGSTGLQVGRVARELLKVKRFADAASFLTSLERGGLYLTPSEIALRGLLGPKYAVVFRYGVAVRRAAISNGAKLAADGELTKLGALTANDGGQWIGEVITLLQRATSCERGIWVDGLSPLTGLPGIGESIQNYLAQELTNVGAAKTLRWSCPGVRTSVALRDRLTIDLFLLFVATEPEPFEVLDLYRSVSPRITDLGVRAVVTSVAGTYIDQKLPTLMEG